MALINFTRKDDEAAGSDTWQADLAKLKDRRDAAAQAVEDLEVAIDCGHSYR